MKRIYLVGYMGAGKTTIGKRLARKLNWHFVDLDQMFEERFHVSVDDFFHKYDEILFRKFETELLKNTETLENVVISTGGGTPCFFDNMTWMNSCGTTIFIHVSPESALQRIVNSKKRRPLVENKTLDELSDYINEQYKLRMPFYTQARFEVKGENCDIDQIVKLLENE